jgi:mannose-6-phosphate isomerase-like protein (cupin superfamily)
MNPAQAEALLGEWLQPLSPGIFFDALGARVVDANGGDGHARSQLLGPRPYLTLLNAFATFSSRLEYHCPAPTAQPPAPRQAESPDDFLALIREYHERGYTVRVPNVAELSPALQRFARALEVALQKPVTACLFWSKAGARAKVHYDNRDNLVVQLSGRKRWFVSTDAPALHNDWAEADEAGARLRVPRVIDVEPGDLLYIPRGVTHTVESTTESLHLAILFTPVTLRETLIAALDHLSDLDRTFRETALPRCPAAGPLPDRVWSALNQLLVRCQSPRFIEEALDHHASRMIGDLPPLPRPAATPSIGAETQVRHSGLAACSLRLGSKYLKFSQPGGHLAIHAGVEREVRFIAATPEFKVRDIPGNSPLEIRAALVRQLIASGFLEAVA